MGYRQHSEKSQRACLCCWACWQWAGPAERREQGRRGLRLWSLAQPVRRASAGAAQEQEQGGRESRLRGLSGEALLSQMPLLKILLARLVDCRPTGGAAHDPVVHVRRGRPALWIPCVSLPAASDGVLPDMLSRVALTTGVAGAISSAD